MYFIGTLGKKKEKKLEQRLWAFRVSLNVVIEAARWLY